MCWRMRLISKILYFQPFSESVLVRIHFMVRVTPAESQQKWDFKKIEQHLIQAGCSWSDGASKFIKTFDEATANT